MYIDEHNRVLPPLSEAVFIALDTETTGLHPVAAELVEVAAVKFRASGEIIDEYCELINPGEPIPASAQAIHGITDEDVAGADGVDKVLPRLIQFLSEPRGVLVAHNAEFDVRFIVVAAKRLSLALPRLPVIDTRLMAYRLIRAPRYSLETLTKLLGIEVQGKHRALPDAHAVRQLFLKLLDRAAGDFLEQVWQEMTVPHLHALDVSPTAVPAGFDELAAALEQGRDLLIVYAGGSKASQRRRITPIALYEQSGRIYLIAFCHVDRKQKNFRLDRISSVEIVD